MIDLDRPLQLFGLSLYADHLDPRTFHVLPGPPRLADAGERLSLIRFRGERSGGFLTLEVDARPDPAALERARAELSRRRSADVSLVPVLFDAGTSRLVVPGEGPEGLLTSQVLGSTTPSLLGDLRASFSLSLTPEGTTLVRQGLEPGGATILGCAWELSFRGLERSRHLAIEVDYHRAWELLSAQAALGTLWLVADARAAVERLRQEGHVRVLDESTAAGSAEDSARRQAEVRTILEETLKPLFWQPDVAPPGAGEGPSRPVRAGLRLRALVQEEQHTLTYDRRETGVRERTVAPQGSLVVPEGFDLGTRTREVEEDLFFAEPRPLRVFAPGGDRWQGVERVLVDVRWEGEETTLELSPERLEAELLVRPGPAEVRVRLVEAEDADVLDSGESRAEPAWQPLTRLNLDLDPAQAAGRRTLEVALGVLDAQVLAAAVVELRAGAGVRTVRLDAERPVERVVVRGTVEVELRARFEAGPALDAGVELEVARRVPLSERLALVQPPEASVLTVTAALVDPLGRHVSVGVEIERADGRGRRELRLTREAPQASWSTLVEAGEGGFRYRTRAVLGGAVVRESAWREGEGTLVLAGDTELRVRALEVALVGVEGHMGGALRAEAVEPAEEAPHAVEIFLEPGQERVSLVVAIQPGGAGEVRISAEVFDEAGEVVALGPVETAHDVVVLGPGGGA